MAGISDVCIIVCGQADRRHDLAVRFIPEPLLLASLAPDKLDMLPVQRGIN